MKSEGICDAERADRAVKDGYGGPWGVYGDYLCCDSKKPPEAPVERFLGALVYAAGSEIRFQKIGAMAGIGDEGVGDLCSFG